MSIPATVFGLRSGLIFILKLKQSKKYLREFYSIPDGVWSCQEDDMMLAVRYVINVANKLGKPISICLPVRPSTP